LQKKLQKHMVVSPFLTDIIDCLCSIHSYFKIVF